MDEEQFSTNAHLARIDNARALYKDLALNEMILEMSKVREQKDELEDQLKWVNARYDVLRIEMVPGKMDEMGVGSPYVVRGLGRVTLTVDLRVKVTDKDELYNWLRDNRLEDLIQNTVNASTLKATMKKRLIKCEEIPASVECEPFTRASITPLTDRSSVEP